MLACKIEPTVEEDVGWTYGEIDNPEGKGLTYGGVLDALPGCNKIQPSPGPASVQSCGSTPAVASATAGSVLEASSAVSSGSSSMPRASTSTTVTTNKGGSMSQSNLADQVGGPQTMITVTMTTTVTPSAAECTGSS